MKRLIHKINFLAKSIFIAIFTLLSFTVSPCGSNVKIKSKTPENKSVIDKSTELWKYIEALTVIDTHEHISSEAELLGMQISIFDLFVPYIVDNLESAGITDDEMYQMKNGQLPFETRWNVFNKYYPTIQSTTYVLALQASLAEQYGFKSYSLEECKRVSDLFAKDFATKGFMQKFMDKNKIESMLTFRGPSSAEVRRNYGDNKIMLVPTVNHICVKDAKSLEEIAALTETPIRNLDDILAGIDKLFKEYAAAGIKNIKFGSAYNRKLNYKYRTREEAEASYAKIMVTPFNYSDAKPNKYYVFHLEDYHIPLDDYITAHMMAQATKYNMNAIFHVGIFAWNFNSVKNNHASSLEWLIKTFPKVNVVILHAGYPYFDEAILLAKYYPNVYINMTWDHIIERGKSIEVMERYIEMLPTSKIHLFGGDYLFPQQIYGNVIFTKENLYITLVTLLQKKILTETQAKQLAIDWLYNNPKAFYYR
jgi:predicted TIM-barrel fold metal-dependent hydrolase